ncbi:MAG: hypothetical protein JJU23_01475, partial [Cyclobacteriaceae bacterium]|nr:hypothetical protein [Cyclobacteriaceae bacterium]
TDSTFMCTMYGSGVKFTEIDLQGNVLNEYGHWRQNTGQDYEELTYLDMFMGRMSAHKDYFLISITDIDHLELLNTKTGKIISIRGPIHHQPEYGINENGQAGIKPETWIDLYIQTQLTDQHIYASLENVKGGARYAFPKRILKFDLDGQILEEFVLDEGVHYFQVDEANNKLYGLSHDVEGAILIFDLPT